MIIMDVDGVMTDGTIFIDANGVETKGFNIRDGFGIVMARRAGIKFGIITGRMSSAVEFRAGDLKIEEVHQGFINKLEVLQGILERHNLDSTEVAYIGDDLFDLPVLNNVGFSAAPADAHELVRENVNFVSTFPGGRGAVREMIEVILKSRDLWNDAVKQYAGL